MTSNVERRERHHFSGSRQSGVAPAYAGLPPHSKIRMSQKKCTRAFFIRHADKLLFGTDSGWWSFGKAPAPEFVLIDELKLPKEVEEKICRQNAERLFWNVGSKTPTTK